MPDNRTLLYTARRRVYTFGDEEVVAVDVSTGHRTVLLHDAADARYVAGGYLLFLRRGMLMAVRFDAASLAVGSPAAIMDGVSQALLADGFWTATGIGQFSVSRTGSLAFIPAGPPSGPDVSLVAVDLSGHVHDLGAPVRPYGPVVRTSPDGTQLAVEVATPNDVGLWLYDLRRPGLMPLVRMGEVDFQLWSPEGDRLMFNWLHDGRSSLAVQRVAAAPPPAVVAAGDVSPATWGPGGELLAIKGHEHEIVAVQGSTMTPFERLRRAGTVAVRWPEISPDGHWLAYAEHNGPGRNQVYVEPYPGPGPRLQVSIDGGRSPAWRRDGRELFYMRGEDGREILLAADFFAGTPARAGRPRRLFDIDDAELGFSCQPIRCYDVAPDGRTFYTTRQHVVHPPLVTHITLVQNWVEGLKSAVPR